MKSKFRLMQEAREKIGLKLHITHDCKRCDVPCAYCKSCGYAHCMNGCEHPGFDGSYSDLKLIINKRENKELKI